LGKAISNLAKSVSISISIRISLTLAIESSISRVSQITTVSNGTITRKTSITIVNSSDDSNIVRVTSGISICLGKAISNLAKSVSISISIRISLTLAIESPISTVDASISQITTVSNGTIARQTTITIVNSSDHSNIMWVTSGICISLG